MKNIFCCIMAMFAITSCGNQISSVDNPRKNVDISEKLSDSFYENVSEYGILSLETTEKSLMSNISKIRIQNDMIFILNGRGNSKLFVFDINGKFITEIGRRGRGPDEHVELYNFEIDPVRAEILLLDRVGRKILIYDFDGNFVQAVPMPSGPECAGRLPNGRFVLSYTGSQLKFNNYHIITICDENGKILEQQIENNTNTSINLSATDMMTVMPNGNFSLMPQFYNTIYRITNEGITAEFGFKIPGETVMTDNFNQNFNDIKSYMNALEGKNYTSGNHAESDRYIFFNNRGMMEMEHVFYNKISGESLRVIHPLFGTPVFIDNDGYCWASVNEARISTLTEYNDELTGLFKEAFGKYDNIPLIYYKLKL